MRSAQRAANWRRLVSARVSSASSASLIAGSAPADDTKVSARPRAATGMKGSGLAASLSVCEDAAPAASAARNMKAPAPARASAWPNRWFTAATNADVERWFVPST